jgi:hypothetical protein
MAICYNLDDLKNIMLSEKSQLQKVTYYMIPFVWNVQSRQIYRKRKQISDCQEQGEEQKWLLSEYGCYSGMKKSCETREKWWLHLSQFILILHVPS